MIQHHKLDMVGYVKGSFGNHTKLERYIWMSFLQDESCNISFPFTAMVMHAPSLQFLLFLNKGVGGRGQSSPKCVWIIGISNIYTVGQVLPTVDHC